MALVPRSRRGTWAVAAAVWLGGCAIIGKMLPTVPRLVVPATEGGHPVGYTADGRWVYGYTGTGVPPGSPDEQFIYRLWDPDTARLVVSSQVPAGLRWSGALSFPYYGTLVLIEDGPDGQRRYVFDMLTGQREELPWAPAGDQHVVFMTSGGRHVVFVTGEPESSPTTCWWDRTTRQIVAIFPGLEPWGVLPDGRWITYEKSVLAGKPWTMVVARAGLSSRICQSSRA